MKLNTPITVDHARIARVLEEGCPHGCTGDAALVKRRIAGGSFQIWIQCLTCGRHLDSAFVLLRDGTVVSVPQKPVGRPT